jgi:hypothetical protein
MKKSNAFLSVTKIISIIVCTVFFLQVIGCGTIMYPERKGQAKGKIDTSIAILDGLGLLLFIIPGVIAFAVDFNNGCIYLPPGKSSKNLNEDKKDNLAVVKMPSNKLDLNTVAQVIKENTGQIIEFDSPDLVILKPNNQNIDICQQIIDLKLHTYNVSKEVLTKGSLMSFILNHSGYLIGIKVLPLNNNTC